jgi:hypothetical protein
VAGEPVARYFVRDERALRVAATPNVVEGRLQGSAAVVIADMENALDSRQVPTAYELFGPGDVLRLGDGAIIRRFPMPGSSDAEETKLPLVEFNAIDLPWRYTPEAASGNNLRPWLVLIVGRRAPGEVILRPDGRIGLGLVTQQGFRLDESWKWAHVHDVDGRQIARVLAPIDLEMETEYVACVVPAFNDDGSNAWTGAAPVTVDCYDRWTFRTGPQGDFPELAEKLHKADLAAIEAAGGRPFGRADVTYIRRVPGDPPQFVISAAGALRLPADPVGAPDPADASPDPAVAVEVGALTERIVAADGRGIVTTPRYDAPFATIAAQAAFSPDGWIEQLRTDPRARGAAGIGAWNAIEWQDRVADAAAAKAGELAVADDRIRHVALGVEASRSMWRRRVPQLPGDLGVDPDQTSVAAGRVLDVLGPVLGRLPTDSGNTVLDAIALRTPQLGRALFSSAARRVLRRGPARIARALDGAGDLGPMFRAANSCPKPGRDPADIRRSQDVPPADVQEAIKAAILAAARTDADLGEHVLEKLFGAGGIPSPSQLGAALRALTPGKDGRPDQETIDTFLHGADVPDLHQSLDGWSEWMDEVAPRERCEPINLVGLAQAVSGAIDPSVERPPAVQRVLATLPGFTHIGPVEIEPELDLPLWSFLSQRSPDWMLPGAGDLIEGDVVGLATNPTFVDALMTGANHQATGELRWRNFRMITRWSPLRKFWQRGPQEFDIVPIKGWPDPEPLGSGALAPGGRGSEAVVAFKTPLFRRYPATVVYLYEATPDFQPPDGNAPLEEGKRKDHTFTGTIGDDITFFGFPVDPSALSTHWVVLEEPPAGYRFYWNEAVPGDDDSAKYAYNRFAVPVRVLIGPLFE